MTDEQIIGRVRSGETRHFGELVRRYQDPVYGMVARFVGGSEDAQDIAQDVFLRVFRGLDGFRGESKFSTWLYRITWNLCADWLRRNKRPNREATVVQAAETLPDRRVDLEEGFLEEEQRVAVRQALNALDEKYRSVVVLHYYQKLSYDQIAEVLDMPVKTVETRLYRARKTLRGCLESSGQGGDA
jgi:RNA polymerase sigma-70 factor (ECF subfamily)